MRRIASALLLAITVGVTTVVPAQANWLTTFCHDVSGSWHTSNMWPHPYVDPDRHAVKEPFAIMHEHGWQRYNLLGEHDFEEDQKRLTSAGVLHVKSILAHSPQHRTVFVEKGRNHSITEARINAIRHAIAELPHEGPPPAVLASDMVVEGSSAEHADAVARKYFSSMLSPRLPDATGSSTGGP